MKLILIVFSIFILCLVAFEAKYPPSLPVSSCTDISELDLEIQKYMEFETKKTYVYTTDDYGNWASGYSYGYDTQEQADERAMAECNKNKITYNVAKECEIYMRGNTLQ